MRLYFVRHGETEWNLKGKKQGRLDSSLTNQGVEQAKYISNLLSDTPIDVIYSSPLERALITASIIGEKRDLKPIVKEELAELDYGNWSGLSDEEIEQKYPGEIERREKNKFYYRIKNGESYEDCQRRASKAIDDILNETHTSVLIVSHEMIGRVMIGCLMHLSNEDMLKIKHPNNVVYMIDTVNQTIGYMNDNGRFQSGIISR